MSDHPTEPDPSDPAIKFRLLAFRNRMLNDLATGLPDDWLANANAKDRTQFREYLVTSETVAAIIDIVSWTAITIEHEEAAAGARPQQ